MDEIIRVTGGAGGVAASYAAARELADAFDAAGDRLREWAGSGLRVLGDPDLLESGLLAPGTCAAAEAAVVAATGGPHGVAAASLGWEADAIAVRVAIECLEQTDAAVRVVIAAADRQAAPFVVGTLTLPVALDPDVLSANPGLTEHLVDGLGGPVAALALGSLYGSRGRPVVAPYAADLPTTRPASVHDLLAHLEHVAALSEGADSPANGTIEVQTVTTSDSDVRHLVYLPGTDDFNAPWDQDDDVRDLETDLDLAGRQPDTYVDGILAALHQAGVRPAEPVLLVGHSLGGMAAAAIVAGNTGYHVTDVVTAGSPTAQVPGFPTGTHVLSLEQRGDIVPELDGAPNPDSVEQTTVAFDADPEPGVLGHHGYDAYEAGAALVDGSDDPSIVEAVASLHHHGFLGEGGEVRSQVFQITRGG
jgi:hypothetical protein